MIKCIISTFVERRFKEAIHCGELKCPKNTAKCAQKEVSIEPDNLKIKRTIECRSKHNKVLRSKTFMKANKHPGKKVTERKKPLTLKRSFQ